MLKFYSHKGKIRYYNFNELKCFDYGNTANIYKIGENIFKKYYAYTSDKYRLDKDTFDILNYIKSKNMTEIYELLYDDENLEEVGGYISKYYERNLINILNQDIDYILDNMNDIEKLFDELSKYLIRVDDVKYKNTILTKDKIILIDPDSYKKVIYSEESLKKINKKALLDLFESIYLNFLPKNESCIKIFDLFDINIDDKTNITYEFSKKLLKK